MLIFHSICTCTIQVYKCSNSSTMFLCFYTHTLICFAIALYLSLSLSLFLCLYICWKSVFVAYLHVLDQTLCLTFIFTSSNQTSLRELRERVANGGDPSKLREPPVVDVDPDGEQGNLLSMYLHFAIQVSNSKYHTFVWINSCFLRSVVVNLENNII